MTSTNGESDPPDSGSDKPWYRKSEVLIISVAVPVLVGVIVPIALHFMDAKGTDTPPSTLTAGTASPSTTTSECLLGLWEVTDPVSMFSSVDPSSKIDGHTGGISFQFAKNGSGTVVFALDVQATRVADGAKVDQDIEGENTFHYTEDSQTVTFQTVEDNATSTVTVDGQQRPPTKALITWEPFSATCTPTNLILAGTDLTLRFTHPG